MKLEKPFIQLPWAFDAERLQAEMSAIPEAAWVQHPDAFNGNSALRLITSGGGENDDVGGVMAATPHLQAMPYVRQVLALFGVVWSRSRFMRLAPGARVPPHADIKYHWHHRTRVHIPVVTDPAVTFHCAGESVHMAAGETWIFDNWRTHSVENASDIVRVHLVADTTGGGRFWDLVRAAMHERLEPVLVPFDPAAETSLMLERHNAYRVMPPSEVDDLVRDLMADARAIGRQPRAARSLTGLRVVLDHFRHDWRALWSLFADTDEGLPRFRERVLVATRQIERLGEGLVCEGNGLPVLAVFAARIANFAVNTQASGVIAGGAKRVREAPVA